VKIVVKVEEKEMVWGGDLTNLENTKKRPRMYMLVHIKIHPYITGALVITHGRCCEG
jgi:hypothetical protein